MLSGNSFHLLGADTRKLLSANGFAVVLGILSVFTLWFDLRQ